jgi:2-phosphosulfolactate phosphatase
MKIDIIISSDDIKKDKIVGKNVIVIDMLRATSVITTAINNGCKSVVPVTTIEEALDIVRKEEAAGKDRKDFILGGERNALKIEGFDCSNSPLEYGRAEVFGKTVVMTTTNGTKAINGAKDAENIYIGAMINARAVAMKAITEDKDLVLVNAGTYDQFSIDDFLCSGYIISLIDEKTMPELTDIATTALYVYKNNKDIFSFIKYASHYKKIAELGLTEDLNYCCQKDIINVVPEYKDGIIS